MTIALIQYAQNNAAHATFASTPTPGNLIVVHGGFGGSATSTGDTGLTQSPASPWDDPDVVQKVGLWYRVVESGDGKTWGQNPSGGESVTIISEWSGSWTASSLLTDGSDGEGHAGPVHSSVTLSPTAGKSVLVFGALIHDNGSGADTLTADSGYTKIAQQQAPTTNMGIWSVYQIVASSSGTYAPGGTNPNVLLYGAAIIGAVFGEGDSPGVWLDFADDGFGSGFSASEAGLLARMMPEGGSSSVSDNITSDVISYTITRGATGELIGGSVTDSATIIVQNSDGKYSPDNTGSSYAQLLRPGRPVWIGVNADGTLSGSGQTVYGRFAGVLREVAPIPVGGVTNTPTTELICDGILADYALTPTKFADSTTRSQYDYRVAILDDVGESASRRDLDEEQATLPLSSLDSTNALSSLEELNKASGTRHFVAPSSSKDTWYKYTSRNRQYKLGAAADASVDAGAQHVTDIAGWRYNNDSIVNSQRASIEPVSFPPAVGTVWTYASIPFTVSGNIVIWANFDDYVDSPTLDINTSSGSVTSSITTFGRAAKIELYSTGAQVTLLRILGRQVIRDSGVTVSQEDLSSQASFRVRAGSDLSGDLLGSQAEAQGIVDHIVYRYGSRPLKRPSATVVNWLPTMFTLSPYDLLTVTVAAVSASGVKFDIVGMTEFCDLAVQAGTVYHRIIYQLQEARIQGTQTWFTWDQSVWDGPDLLAY